MRVPAVRTPWGTPWNHTEIAQGMDDILLSCGVNSAAVRVRMAAHAIVASGWRQAVWCFNCWGVKSGKSWTGDFYLMDTQEDDGSGSLYDVPAESWRAFYSWREAVDDFRNRISPISGRYARAFAALVDETIPDSEYWAELGDAGYYTDTQNMTHDRFASLCRRVRSEVAKKKSEAVDTRGSVPLWTAGFVLGVFSIVAGLTAIGVGIVRAHVR